MHSKEYYENLADIERSGIPREDIDKIYDDLSAIHKKCLEKSDDLKENVIKTYILEGDVEKTRKALGLKSYDGTDFIRLTLMFYRLPDKELTLFAKSLYAKKGRGFSEFLRQQVSRLIEDYDYDIFKHYMEFNEIAPEDNPIQRFYDIERIKTILEI